jgi:hypothetical protein
MRVVARPAGLHYSGEALRDARRMSAVALAIARHAADARLGLPCPPRACCAVGLSRPACRAALRDLGALAPNLLNTYHFVQACRSAHMHGGHLSRHRVLVVGRDVNRDLPACVTQNSPKKWKSDP